MKSVALLLGQRVRYERKLAGLTQPALAERLGITRGYIMRIELAKANPTLQLIIELAEVLNVSPGDLLGGQSQKMSFKPYKIA
jgi:transcriptional regulator with XRE-family HTH domain